MQSDLQSMMTLGSLFDGSGGFPLAGMLNGLEPVWASEIAPYPLLVTRTHFPKMEHLGSVLDIDGSKIRPVGVVTFGSPCQDLSTAGKQAGIVEGERSNLFFQAARILREMRKATNGKYPRFATWENVPGAFSSRKGEDFRAVLSTLCSIAEGQNVSVPLPEKKWGVQAASWETVTQLPGKSMMLNIGPGPHNGGSVSTLSSILVLNAPEKYYLSKRACEGILRRAKKRGKALPPMLLDALLEVVIGEAPSVVIARARSRSSVKESVDTEELLKRYPKIQEYLDVAQLPWIVGIYDQMEQ